MPAAPSSPAALTAAATPAATLTFTGERFLPDVRGTIWYEHWHRYAAVAPLAAGRRVLDAACGEGYGSHLLAHEAAHVTGVDVSRDAIAHARERYARANLAFAAASVTALPLPDASVDLVVSFETVEHLAEQAAMVAEFRRVLAPAGVLVISSPNRPVYSEGGVGENHYHVRELDRDELAALLAPAFPRQAWYAQRVIAQSALWSEAPSAAPVACLALPGERPATVPAPAAPMYFVVVCGGDAATLPALPALSLFDDGALSLWRDYVRALVRAGELEWAERDARKVADERESRLVAAVNALASAREAVRVQGERIASLESALAATQGTAQAAIARLEGALVAREAALADAQAAAAAAADAHAREAAAHGETQARLAYRESARGWLRYPLFAARRAAGGRRR